MADVLREIKPEFEMSIIQLTTAGLVGAKGEANVMEYLALAQLGVS